MKIRIQERVDVDTEIDLTAEQLTAAIREEAERLAAGSEGENSARILGHYASCLVNTAGVCLRAITSEMIATKSVGMRQNTRNFLLEQADRFKTNPQGCPDERSAENA